MRTILTLLAAALTASAARGQRLNPDDYIYPVRDVPGLYSANFGELRPGHFHAGIDIKTDGVEGKALVAVADGHVSRVVLQPGGYGRAVYLTLDNGVTAVYGHLRNFRDDIEEHVRSERYARRANSVDLWFEAGRWPVAQGDTIGWSGNSGSSMGPHLHFELRDTPTQRLHNLVREGVIRPKDNLPPRIMRLHYVEIDTLDDGTPVRSRPHTYAVVREAEGRYRLARGDGAVEVGRRGYFVAEVSDRRNDVQNTFGVWRVQAAIDGEPYFEYRMDGFTHDLSRCCDAVSCYPVQVASRNEAIRLARLDRSPELFYPILRERGLVRAAAGERHRIRIEAEDDCGNISALEFEIEGRDGEFRAEADPQGTALRPDRTATMRIGNSARMTVPEGALYEPIHAWPEIRQAPAAPKGVRVFSPAYHFLDTAAERCHRLGECRHTPGPAAAHGAGPPQPPRRAGIRRRALHERCGDGLDPHGRRPGGRGRHAGARRQGPLRTGRRPLARPVAAVPRRGQLLGDCGLEARDRRRMGPLRPFPDARHARAPIRPSGLARPPHGAPHRDGRLRKHRPPRDRVRAVTPAAAPHRPPRHGAGAPPRDKTQKIGE